MSTNRGSFSPMEALFGLSPLQIEMPPNLPSEDEQNLILRHTSRLPGQVHLLPSLNLVVVLTDWLGLPPELGVLAIYNHERGGETRVSLLLVGNCQGIDPRFGTSEAQSPYVPTRMLPAPAESQKCLRLFAQNNKLNFSLLMAVLWAADHHIKVGR